MGIKKEADCIKAIGFSLICGGLLYGDLASQILIRRPPHIFIYFIKNFALNFSMNENLTKLQLVKLWENPNPSATTFSVQTITLSSGDYDYLRVVSKGGISIQDFIKGDFSIEGLSVAGTTPVTFMRPVTYNSATSLTIQHGWHSKNDMDDSVCIPLAIYGGKFV